MQYETKDFFGFEMLEFDLDGRRANLIIPPKPRKDKRWFFKTEYLTAFPAFDIEMLNRGYYVATVSNISRWCLPEDIDAKARLCDFLTAEFGLYGKCMTIGLSCGGLQSVYFAAKYPEYVAAIYLDAPVLNLLSCPFGVGEGVNVLAEEFIRDTGKTLSEMINYRNHPIDKVDLIISKGIPAMLICGDSDHLVPYLENGKILSQKYRDSEVPFVEILKKNCDHHPHGLDDLTPMIDFTERYYG